MELSITNLIIFHKSQQLSLVVLKINCMLHIIMIHLSKLLKVFERKSFAARYFKKKKKIGKGYSRTSNITRDNFIS